MGKIKYIYRVLSNASFKKLFKVIDRAHEKSGKSKLFLFLDIVNCAFRYGAGYNDYLIFAFWNMNHRQRSTYVTRLYNKKVILKVNDPRYAHIFDNKNEFYERFDKYLHREWLDMAKIDAAAFDDFVKRHKTVVAKPNDSESGKGILVVSEGDYANPEAEFEELKQKRIGVIEEKLIQHDDMMRLHPASLNTLRIATLVTRDGDVQIAFAGCKIGNKGKFVDNMENDGLYCPIDRETGEINGVAHTSALVNYEVHPMTGIRLIGYRIPYVKEALELCKKAALEIPEFRYVGWDIAILQDGPAIVEGNNYSGYDFWQLPEHTPDKIGLKPFFEKYI